MVVLLLLEDVVDVVVLVVVELVDVNVAET